MATKFPAPHRASEQDDSAHRGSTRVPGVAALIVAAAVCVAACSGGGNSTPGSPVPFASGSSSSSVVVLPSVPAPGPQSPSETGSTLFYPLFQPLPSPVVTIADALIAKIA